MPFDASKGENARLFGGGVSLFGGSKKYQEELDWFRNHDSFTNLPNMNMVSQDFLNLEDRGRWGLALIHYNNFTQLNSIFGLDLGGKTIQRVCDILSECAKQMGGRAYRLSIDRLVLLAPYTDRDGFLSQLRGMLGRMEAVQVEDQHAVYSYHYTFLYSAYFLSDEPDEYQDVKRLLAFLDMAAKREAQAAQTGGAVYDLKTKPKWAQREALLADVQSAWKNGEFEPCFQPAYDLLSNRPIGAELLLRWRHPVRGLIPPGDFLPLIEAEGLMMDLDLYMLNAACRKIRDWMDAELLTIPLSINICKQNIYRADFLPRLIEIVTSYGIPPVLIELELSESAILYEKSEEFSFMVDQLHRIGFTLTMDNFAATELSSISLLRNLPLDAVKISNRFLDHVGESERDRIFVTNFLRMTKELGVKAIATGIETREQLSTWLNLGCSIGQGFHLSKPLFYEDFEKLIF